jgi:CheY-like chemotaxis protein
MPGLSGLDVAREVSRIRPDLPVVIFSGHVDAELQRKARELGVREVVNKLDPQEELLRVTARLTGN